METSNEPHSTDGSATEVTDESASDPGSLQSVALGGFVGIPIGAVFGAATCFMTGMWDELWQGVRWGAIAGFVVGSLTILLDRARNGPKEQQVIASRVGMVIGLVPTVFVVMRIGQGAKILLLIGAVFIGPAIGLMIGAFFDRAIDEWRSRSKATAVLFTALGIGICGLLISWIDSSAYGVSEKEIELAVRDMVSSRWRHDPDMEEAVIQNIVVVRNGRRNYLGTFDATLGAETIPFGFAAENVGDDVFLEWQSMVE